MQTCTRQSIGENDSGGLFALNLDPDGNSFWTAGVDSGMVYRVDIESGAVLTAFNSGTGGVSGLAVHGEIGDDSIFADGFELVWRDDHWQGFATEGGTAEAAGRFGAAAPNAALTARGTYIVRPRVRFCPRRSSAQTTQARKPVNRLPHLPHPHTTQATTRP